MRASLPHQRATGAFMRLSIAYGAARLVAAATPVAGVAEIHRMSMADNIARMERVEGVRLVAGEPVELSPGGYHLMLMDLREPLQAGRTVPITLEFELPDGSRRRVEVSATVRPLNAAAGMPHSQ